MYSLMGRPAIVSTEQILEVARELFLSQGFGVTTAAIARKAGVSEGSVFKRFATKEALFFAALGIPEQAWLTQLPGRVGQGDVRENLAQIVVSIIGFYRELFPRMIMLWSCRAMAAQGEMWKDVPESPPMRVLKALTQYLEGEMQAKRLRQANAEVVARAALGSAQSFVFFEMTGLKPGGETHAAEFARELSDVLFLGLVPPQLHDK